VIRSTTLRAACVALLIALSACASKPERFYTLQSVAETTETPSAVSVSVGPVTIPAIVDTPAIVLTVGQSEVQLDDAAHWASPLQDSIAHVVAGDLSALLGTERVTLSSDTWTQALDYRVAIEVQRFESVPDEAATLDAVWTIRDSHGTVAREGRTTVREATQGGGIGELAAAHSRALARLSADIAAAIRSLGEPKSARR
jgi:uncharacterized protein